MTSAERLETLGYSPEPSTHGLESYSRHEPYVDAREGAAFLHMHPKTLMRLARDALFGCTHSAKALADTGAFSFLSWTNG